MANPSDLVIKHGKTYSEVVRWGVEPRVYKAITGISLTNGAPRLTVVGHGLVDGWKVAVTRVSGMKQINAESCPPTDDDYVVATVIDADHIELNTVCPCDENGKEWPAYTSGGFIQYWTPQDLTGYTARESILNRLPNVGEKVANIWRASTAYAAGDYVVLSDGTTILQCATGGTSGVSEPTSAGTDGTVTWQAVTSFSGPIELMHLSTENGRISIDNATKKIIRTISAADTAAITWKKGVTDLEMVSPGGVVTAIIEGQNVIVTKEATT